MNPLLIGALLGLGKSALIDSPKEKRQRELAAKTQELSPWTGLKAAGIEEADPFGSALKYGTTGAMMGSASAEDAYKKSFADALAKSIVGKGQNPYTQLSAMPEMSSDYGMKSKYGIYGE